MHTIDRKLIEMLRILSEQNEPVGARFIAKKLSERGYRLDERTIRYHLRILDERGLTKNLGYEGRIITDKGLEEVKNALVTERVGFIITKIEALIFKMDFNVDKAKGQVVVNLATLKKDNFKKAFQIMKRVILAGYAVSPFIKVFDEGEAFKSYTVPEGKVMVATICSITLDGILHRAGIPVSPKFGGVIQVLKGKPYRFTDIISYAGSTLDPLDLFATKGLSSVLKVVESGKGHILANFREIPMDAAEIAKEKLEVATEIGINGVIEVGEPNSPVLAAPVGIDRVGIALMGGTNPLAAVSETKISIETRAIESLIDFGELTHVNDVEPKIIL